jgi:hypothetical protein
MKNAFLPIRRIMLVCLLLLIAVPQLVSATGFTYKGMWPTLPKPWYFNQPNAVAFDGSGNAYVADTENNRIQKFDSSGTLLKKWGTNGAGDGQLSEPQGILVGKDGYIYVVDTTNSRIQKFDAAGNFVARWGDVNSPNFNDPGQFQFPRGIAQDSQGNFYVTDTGNYRIQKFDSGFNFIASWGTPPTHELNHPYGIAVDSSDNIYVTEWDGNRVKKLTSTGTSFTEVRKWGTTNALSNFNGNHGNGNGEFFAPQGIAVDSQNNFYVADSWNNRIQKFDSAGNFVANFGTAGGGDTSFIPPPWAGTGNGNNQFNHPYGVAVDPAGNVNVVDSGNNRIQKLGQNGTYISSWYSQGGGNGLLAHPNKITTDSNGNIYVVDTDNKRIQEFDSGWNYIRTFSGGQLGSPQGVGVDSNGNVYVSGDGRVVKFDSSGAVVNAFSSFYLTVPQGLVVSGGLVYVADTRSQGFAMFNLDGTSAEVWQATTGTADGHFNGATDITVDKDGNFYVADTGNNRIQKFSPSRSHLATWGGPDPGSGDGQFNGPTSVAVDYDGNIYVTDKGNSRIQMLNSSGAFVASWGSYGSDANQLNTPGGLAVNSVTGDLYAVDTINGRIHSFSTPVPDRPVVDFTVPATTSSLTVTFTTFSATGTGSITGYMVTESATAPAVSSSGWAATAPTTYTFTSAGSKTLYGWAKNAAGAVSLGKKATTTVTLPSFDLTLTVTGGNGTIHSTPAPDIACTETTTPCSQSYAGATILKLIPTAASGYAFAGWTGCDSVAMNIICTVTMNAAKTPAATFSLAPPTTTATPPGGTYRAAQDVTLKCTPSDSSNYDSWCDNMYYSLDSAPDIFMPFYKGGAPIAISTNQILRYYSVDKSGHAEAVNTAVYTIDSTLPASFVPAPLPNTGQTKCYDYTYKGDPDYSYTYFEVPCAGTGQDGDKKAGVALPASRFTDNGNGTVTDKMTGLIWLKNANCFGSQTWTDAVTSSIGVSDGSCGLTDGSTPGQWRLPNINELKSLIILNGNSPALPTGHPFTDVATGNNPGQGVPYYYTSSDSGGLEGVPFSIDMASGNWGPDYGGKFPLWVAWPVRDGNASSATVHVAQTGKAASYVSGDDGSLKKGVAWSPDSRFTVNTKADGITSNGTVTDNLTGLVWMQNSSCLGSMAFHDVFTWAGTLADGSCGIADASKAGDWRIPNINEILSLADYSRYYPVLPMDNPFLNFANNAYWSSSSYNQEFVMSADMQGGAAMQTNRYSGLYAWAVRDAKASGPADTTKPVVTFTVPATVTSLTITFTAFGATDNVGGSGVNGYMVTESATAPSANDSGWNATAPTTYTFTTGGAKSLYGWAKDAAGNVSLGKKATTTVNVDTTPPLVTVFTVPAVKSLAITGIAITATDTGGVASYLITESTTLPDSPVWLTTKPTSYTLADNTPDGSKTLYAWAKDNAGNISSPKSATFTVNIPPVVNTFTVTTPVTDSLTIPVPVLSATDNSSVAGYLITLTATAPTAATAGWSSTAPTTYVVPTEGAKTLYAWAKDAAGNVSLAKTATATVDKTKPVVSAFTVPAVVNSITVTGIAITATDNVAVGSYQITESSSAPAADDTNWKTVKPTSYTFASNTSEGSKTLYAWAKDTVGNVSSATAASSKTFSIKIPPVIDTFTVTTPVTDGLSITVTALHATDNTAVTGYLITATATTPLATATGWSADKPASYTVTTEGLKTLYAWAKDAAGNVSLAKTATATVDKTKPTVTVFTLPAAMNNLTVPVTTITATDNVAVGSYQITESATAPAADDSNWKSTKPTSYAFASDAADGSKTLYAWAKDTSGNVSLSKSATVTIDRALPVVSAFSVPAIVNSLTVPVTTLTASDNNAVAGYLITASSTVPTVATAGWSATKPVKFQATTAGSTTLYAWVKDTAGNVSTDISNATATVNIDMTKPVVDTFTVTTPVTDGLTIPVTAINATDNNTVAAYLITLTATAPLATANGWSADKPASYTVTTEGIKILYAWAKDTAGNVSLAKTATATVDKTKPTVTAFALPTAVNSLTVPFTTITVTDNVGGGAYLITESTDTPTAGDSNWKTVKPTSYTFASDAADGSKTLYAWAKDTVGNVSLAAKSATVTLDRVLPAVSAFTVPPNYNSLTVPVTTFTASDSGTSIAGYKITLTATAPLASATGWSVTKPVSFVVAAASASASTTLYAWVKDAAGNVSASASATVNIDIIKPVVSVFTVPATVSGSLTVPFTTFTVSDNIGVTGYLITLSATVPLATATTWSSDKPASYDVTTTGIKKLYAWVKDAAGNVSLAKYATVTVQP